jgi:hypothetical protein
MGFGRRASEWMLAKYGMTELRQARGGDSFVSHFGSGVDTVDTVRDAVDHMLVPGAFDRIWAARTREVGTVNRIWTVSFPESLYRELLEEREAAKE